MGHEPVPVARREPRVALIRARRRIRLSRQLRPRTAFGLSWRFAREQSTRDVLLAFGVAIVTSLLVNDSAAYELTAGIAVVGALARFAPAPAPARAPVLAPAVARLLVRAGLRPEPVPVPVPVPSEWPPG